MNTEQMSESISFALIEPRIALVTIERPDSRNAVNADVAQGLECAIARVERDADIWVALLTGAGNKAFCAGADLKEVSAGNLDDFLHGRFPFVHTPRQKPWIAAANGVAVAGGFELALACDMLVASTEAASVPEVKRGLIAAAGGLYRLARVIPRQLASELALTGSGLSVERAYDLGIVNRIARPGEAIAEALVLARAICANAPIAVRESLAQIKLALDYADEDLRDRSHEAQRRVIKTEDFAEGPRAFVEKRAPIWLNR